MTNRPVRFNDPSGHRPCGDGEEVDCSGKLKNPITTVANCSGSSCRGGSGDPDLNLDDFQLPPGLEFTCTDCPQSMPDDYLSFLHFSTSDICYSLHLGPGVCSADTRKSAVDQSADLIRWLITSYTWGSFGLGFADAMHWVHAPVVGIVIDGTIQVTSDADKDYTFMQRAIRTVVFVGEGQISSWAGVTLAGLDAIPGAVTGPADVIIIGGAYVIGSASTSFFLNQFNGYIIDSIPGASNYFPYEPVTLPEEWYEPQ